MWLGYLDEYQDYMTQGTSLDDLNYTAIVRGKTDVTGVGLVEIYGLN